MRFLVWALLIPAGNVFAADAASGPDLLASTLQMFAGLVVIVGLLLLIYAASKKGFFIVPQKKSGLIKIIETRPLGGRKFLCLVQVRGQELLLGLSHDRIDTLAHLSGGATESFQETLEQATEEQQG